MERRSDHVFETISLAVSALLHISKRLFCSQAHLSWKSAMTLSAHNSWRHIRSNMCGEVGAPTQGVTVCTQLLGFTAWEAHHAERIRVWKRELRVCFQAYIQPLAEVGRRYYSITGTKGWCSVPALGGTSGILMCRHALWAVLLLETSLQALPLLHLINHKKENNRQSLKDTLKDQHSDSQRWLSVTTLRYVRCFWLLWVWRWSYFQSVVYLLDLLSLFFSSVAKNVCFM